MVGIRLRAGDAGRSCRGGPELSTSGRVATRKRLRAAQPGEIALRARTGRSGHRRVPAIGRSYASRHGRVATLEHRGCDPGIAQGRSRGDSRSAAVVGSPVPCPLRDRERSSSNWTAAATRQLISAQLPRIRLGYVSAFLDKRNWMKPVWGLIGRHDRQRFEIHLFSDVARSTVEHGYRIDPRDHFHETSDLANRALARRIEELQIDILIDLNGYSRPSRLPLFMMRPAPVQVAWFNMFATSGMSGFDVIVGDDHVVLADEEPYFTERVVRVPGSYLTFEVNYPVPDVTPAPCLRRPGISFGCLAPQYKITVDVVEAWAAHPQAVSRDEAAPEERGPWRAVGESLRAWPFRPVLGAA